MGESPSGSQGRGGKLGEGDHGEVVYGKIVSGQRGVIVCVVTHSKSPWCVCVCGWAWVGVGGGGWGGGGSSVLLSFIVWYHTPLPSKGLPELMRT